MKETFRCGFVALLGRPNVGKSTLLNRLVGRKISIVTPKAQTTRHRILGIVNRPDAQIVFVDTPGVHQGDGSRLNRLMNRAATVSVDDADLVLFLVDALRWSDQDQRVLDDLKGRGAKIMLVINKIDRVKDKKRLLPYIEQVSGKADFDAIVPISAKKQEGLERLYDEIIPRLPVSPGLYEDGQTTDRGNDFQIAEIIREKLMLMLREEIPYGTTVELEKFEESGKGFVIAALVWVARAGQKKIVIGRKGSMMKKVGEAARVEIARMLGKPVHLELWVKVREKWTDSEAALKSMGYDSQ